MEGEGKEEVGGEIGQRNRRGRRSRARRGERHRRRARQCASRLLFGAAATTEKREERRGRRGLCVTTGREWNWYGEGKGAASRRSSGPRHAAAADPPARACGGCRWGVLGRARRPGGGGTLCLALPTPRTDSSGAQGLWKVNLQPNHSQPRPKGVRAQLEKAKCRHARRRKARPCRTR